MRDVHRSTRIDLIAAFAAAISIAMVFPNAFGETHVDPHDALDAKTWEASFSKSELNIVTHARQDQITKSGVAAERIHAVIQRAESRLLLSSALPHAQVLDELTLTVWLRATQPGAILGLRVVFPHQIDPRTGKTLHLYVEGDRYTRTGEWQQLSCKSNEKQLEDEVRRLRFLIGQQKLDLRDPFVDQAVLEHPGIPGTVDLVIDDLEFGPIVAPSNLPDPSTTALLNPQVEVSSPIEFRLGEVRVEGKPFFPRIAPYHSEPPESFAAAGFNVAWVPDYRDFSLLDQLQAQGVWSTAMPPRATDEEGRVLPTRHAELVPFPQETRPILFWNLGPRISRASLKELAEWRRQIRQADSQFDRPLLADVADGERVYSRYLDMLAASRHITHTTFGYKDYVDWLQEKRRTARPGTFFWTWIQTEPASGIAERRAEAGLKPVVIEPEQIRQQVYAALGAGARGIAYWKLSAFDDSNPLEEERRLTVTQLNLELSLVESMLATGVPVGTVQFNPTSHQLGSSGQRTHGETGTNTFLKRDTPWADDQSTRGIAEAAMLRTSKGLLMLPVWFGENAQLVPPQMAARDVEIVVPGVYESASAWEISTTGIRNLERKRVPGGIRIVIPQFDQTSMVLVTSDRSYLGTLQQRAEEMSEQSAKLQQRLAELKFHRVRSVYDELRGYGVKLPDGPQLFARAGELLGRSTIELDRRQYSSAAVTSAQANQLLRIVQYAHWRKAIRSMSSPLSSPYTIAYSSLPDHWRLISRLGESVPTLENSGNSLLSGDFESIDSLVTKGWEHSQNDSRELRAAAELHPEAKDGRYALRLVAHQEVGVEPQQHVNKSPVTVRTPPIAVKAGQLLHISGWIRIRRPVTGNADGVTLHDSLLGPPGALRWKNETGWQQFEMLREVYRDDEFTLTLTLHGMGDILFDNLRIIPHNPPPPKSTKPTTEEPSRLPAAGWLERIPYIPSLRGEQKP
ncbi:hypothetical protein [Calycomorphotria hydatis]|uniref:Uncharacterized protein n=1 Tax=Calycomorphotria hydatis TaxID=2528027 RepID=A0A517T482_9PLAN|nr:hypothetical protein [Calycomorphotria hydatis]QDT63171.1 hypothetical protein V22_03890 [Calycomorphotria hydatis]